MKPTILFVDDELSHRKLFLKAVDQEQYNVVLTDTTDNALQELRQNDEICVVITDYNMPVKNGLILLEEVGRKWPHIARIMCTAIADIDVAKNAINLGKVSAYFNKPWDIDELLIAINNGIEEHQKNLFNSCLSHLYRCLEKQDIYYEKLITASQEYIVDSCSAIRYVNSSLLEEKECSASNIKLSNLACEKIKNLMSSELDYVLMQKKRFEFLQEKIGLQFFCDDLMATLGQCFSISSTIDFSKTDAQLVIQCDAQRLKRFLLCLVIHINPAGDKKIKLHIKAKKSTQYLDGHDRLIFKITYDNEPTDFSTVQQFAYASSFFSEDAMDYRNDHALFLQYFDLYVTNLALRKLNGEIGCAFFPHANAWLELPLIAE